MSSSLHLILFVVLSILHRSCLLASASPPASPPPSSTDLIEQTCRRCALSSANIDYGLCVASLSSMPKSRHANLRELAMISVNIAIKNATHARSKAKKLLEDHSKDDKYMVSCLDTCVELYSEAVLNLQHSNRAIKIGQFADVKVYISSAVDAPVVCEDGFSDGELESPLTKVNNDLFKLAVIPLAMTTYLE